MCVTPAGKIGNCTCGMPKLLPHSGKKSSLLSLFNRSKTVSSHFLFLPLFHPEGSGVLKLPKMTCDSRLRVLEIRKHNQQSANPFASKCDGQITSEFTKMQLMRIQQDEP